VPTAVFWTLGECIVHAHADKGTGGPHLSWKCDEWGPSSFLVSSCRAFEWLVWHEHGIDNMDHAIGLGDVGDSNFSGAALLVLEHDVVPVHRTRP
jgi:hypothetical protein